MTNFLLKEEIGLFFTMFMVLNMLTRPSIQVKKLFRDANAETKDLVKYVFEKVDAITLWIVGFSLTSLGVLTTNILGIKSHIKPDGIFNIKTILLMLVISIVCGVLYRWVFLVLYVKLIFRLKGIDEYLSEEKGMDTVSRLDGTETYQELVNMSQQYVNISPDVIGIFEKSTNEQKEVILEDLKNRYLQWVQDAKNENDNVLDFVADSYEYSLGISKEKFKRMLEKPIKKHAVRNLARLCTTLYFLFLALFIGSLCIFFVISDFV